MNWDNSILYMGYFCLALSAAAGLLRMLYPLVIFISLTGICIWYWDKTATYCHICDRRNCQREHYHRGVSGDWREDR